MGREYRTKGQWQCSLAGKITIGLTLHWPCVTHCRISIYMLNSLIRQLSTPLGMASFAFLQVGQKRPTEQKPEVVINTITNYLHQRRFAWRTPQDHQDDVERFASLSQTVRLSQKLVERSAKHRTSHYIEIRSPVTSLQPHQPPRDDLPPAEEWSTQHVYVTLLSVTI